MVFRERMFASGKLWVTSVTFRVGKFGLMAL